MCIVVLVTLNELLATNKLLSDFKKYNTDSSLNLQKVLSKKTKQLIKSDNQSPI